MFIFLRWLFQLVVDILMTGEHLALIFRRVGLVQLRSFIVQRARARYNCQFWVIANLVRSCSYLFGSPNRLCRLSNTVCTLYTALHLSFKMSRHIRPLKSMFGW